MNMGNLILRQMGVSSHTNSFVSNSDTETLIRACESDGGKIVDGNWIRLVIGTMKMLDIYSSCKFLGDANMGVKLATGNGVSKLWDFSGNSNHATQNTGANQPVWTSNQHGTKSGLVGESSKYLNLTSLSTARNIGALTMVAVVKRTGDTPGYNGAIISYSTNNSGYGRGLINVLYSTNKFTCGGRRLDEDPAYYLTGGGASTNTTLLVADFRYSTSGLYLYKNGSLLDSSTSFQTDGNTSDTDSAYAGLMSFSHPSSTYFPGVLFTAIIFTATLSESQRNILSTTINTYYSIY